jgi:hypothetical protein
MKSFKDMKILSHYLITQNEVGVVGGRPQLAFIYIYASEVWSDLNKQP